MVAKADIFDLVVVGGGAAGFFGAINAASQDSTLKILILEKSNRLLTKVRISGGGRCNVTHHCFEPSPLSRHYPRGQKQLKKMFREFQAKDVVTWFNKRGVELKTESDGRMFPTSNSSDSIIECFIAEAERLEIRVEKNVEIVNIESKSDNHVVESLSQKKYLAKQILITIGGSSKRSSYQWIEKLGHQIIKPIPSLFTFNDRDKRFKDLMGISVKDGRVQIAGTNFKESGPILLTHWGLSGPAVIKLSAWAAKYLFEQNYSFAVLVNWIGETSEEDSRTILSTHTLAHPKKIIMKDSQFGLPNRLWIRLCELSEITESKIWSELSKRSLNKLIENLIRCPFQINGKTTFKEEFVTCGGIDLNEIDLETMESKKVSRIYFAGEVMDIDGETGGFNFQSAWTTSYLAAKAIIKNTKTSEAEV